MHWGKPQKLSLAGNPTYVYSNQTYPINVWQVATTINCSGPMKDEKLHRKHLMWLFVCLECIVQCYKNHSPRGRSNLHPTETRYSFIRFRSAWARSCDAPLEWGQGAAVTSAPGETPRSRLSVHIRNSSPFESRIPPSGVPHNFQTYTLLPPHSTKKAVGARWRS